MSTSHETKVRIAMSFYVDVSTESHPEDIAKDLMDEIVQENALAYLRQLTMAEELDSLIDEYDYEDVKMTEE